jgi:hypothetical protein
VALRAAGRIRSSGRILAARSPVLTSMSDSSAIDPKISDLSATVSRHPFSLVE